MEKSWFKFIFLLFYANDEMFVSMAFLGDGLKRQNTQSLMILVHLGISIFWSLFSKVSKLAQFVPNILVFDLSYHLFNGRALDLGFMNIDVELDFYAKLMKIVTIGHVWP